MRLKFTEIAFDDWPPKLVPAEKRQPFMESQAASALALVLPKPLTQLVLDYYLSYEDMGYRCDRTVFAGDDCIQGEQGHFVVRMSDGTVTSYGAPTDKNSASVEASLKDVKALCHTWWGGFAAIVGEDNSVTCWGDPDYGGDCSAVASELKHVEGICASTSAFAALRRDGTVICWGDKECGGSSPALKGVKAIYSSGHAFAAVLEDGTVEAWGDEVEGSIPPSVKARLKHVQRISGTFGAFAALLSDGTVETWGHHSYGAAPKAVLKFTEVALICASHGAFAALKKDGTVVSWIARGESEDPGDSSWVQRKLTQVVAIGSTYFAFAAVRSDGSVVTWGGRSAALF